MLSLLDLFGEGDKLAKAWNLKGTHDGDFFFLASTHGSKVDPVRNYSYSNGGWKN